MMLTELRAVVYAAGHSDDFANGIGSFDGHHKLWPPIKMPPPCQMANLHSFAATGPFTAAPSAVTMWTMATAVRCRQNYTRRSGMARNG